MELGDPSQLFNAFETGQDELQPQTLNKMNSCLCLTLIPLKVN